MEKKINLIIFPGNFLPHIGGLETHVDEFAKYLSKNKNYNITIFSPNVAYGTEEEIIHSDVKVLRYPAIEIVSNYPFPKVWLPKFWQMFFNLYKNKYDIVMTRTRFFNNSTLGMFFAKFRIKRIKLIHVEHGSEFVKLSSELKSFVAWIYDMIFGKLLFKLADKNIAISSISQDFSCREFNLKKNQVPIIRRGIDMQTIDKFKKDENFSKQFKDKIILSYIGRFYDWKGLANAIKAYKNLPESVKNKTVFVIGGFGEDLNRLKQLAGSDLNNNIFFPGKIDFGHNYSIMKSSDIHVHSSYPGGALSSTLLQFMYCKAAVVASPHEGAKDVIFDKQNGILLKSNSPKELANGMQILIGNKRLRDKYSKEAHKYIKENFNWEKVIDEYIKVFNEVMN